MLQGSALLNLLHREANQTMHREANQTMQLNSEITRPRTMDHFARSRVDGPATGVTGRTAAGAAACALMWIYARNATSITIGNSLQWRAALAAAEEDLLCSSVYYDEYV